MFMRTLRTRNCNLPADTNFVLGERNVRYDFFFKWCHCFDNSILARNYSLVVFFCLFKSTLPTDNTITYISNSTNSYVSYRIRSIGTICHLVICFFHFRWSLRYSRTLAVVKERVHCSVFKKYAYLY